jgi:long-chain-fatty-acid--CoA ligase ACSBG
MIMLIFIFKGIKRANEKAISRVARVQKFSIIPKDFSQPGGELGPTMKLRRQIVTKKYENIIENMYKDEKE